MFKNTMKPLTKIILINIFISLFIGALIGGIAGIFAAKTDLSDIQAFLRKSQLFGLKNNQAEIPNQIDFETDKSLATGEKFIYISEEEAVAQAVRKVSPSVVSIIVTKELSAIYNLTGPSILPFDDFFEFGFPLTPQPYQTEPKTEKREVGGGTGFVVSSDGLILTNRHVVDDPDAEYTVITSDDQKFKAQILAIDPFVDAAIVKIDAKDLPAVSLGDSDKIQIGQTVIAIGNTLSEYRNTVTKGVVSGINRRVVAGGRFGTEVIEEAIQTDAAINPGNSGGPLVNLMGEVIGVNTAISREGQLIGFAIPINLIKPVIESVKTYGRIVRPWLGVRYVLINEQFAKENQLPSNYGALVARGQKETDLAVIPGSPADKAGIMENDIILEIDGVKINENNPLAKLIQKHKPGDKIQLKILHKGSEKSIEAVLAELNQ